MPSWEISGEFREFDDDWSVTTLLLNGKRESDYMYVFKAEYNS